MIAPIVRLAHRAPLVAPTALIALCISIAACDSVPVHHEYSSSRPPPRVVVRNVPRAATAPSRPQQDGLPMASAIPPGVMDLPDAVPRLEPRSVLGNPDSYEVYGERYSVLTDYTGYKERGIASWYGTKFNGKNTSSGEPYDMFQMTAAHKTLPIPCYLRVTNLNNGRSTVVRVNDRGPFHDQRIIDVSYVAALKLGIVDDGSAPVEIEALTPNAPGAPTLKAQSAMPGAATLGAASGAAPPAVRSPSVVLAYVPAAATTPGAATAAPLPAAQSSSASATYLPVAAARPLPASSGIVASSGTSGATGLFDNGGFFWLQAGSFIDPLNAAALRDQLNTLGIANVQLKVQQRGASAMHRVLIGPFANASSRDAVRSRLALVQMPAVPVTN